jgi:hypothetical protein
VYLLERVGPATYIAKVSPTQLSAAQSLEFVTGLSVYGAAATEMATSAFGTRDAAAAPPNSATPMKTFDAQLHDATDLPEVLAAIAQLSLPIAGAKGRKIRFYVLEAEVGAKVPQVKALVGVKKVEPYIEPGLHSAHATLSPLTSPRDYRDRAEALTGISLRVCQACHHGEMIIIERLSPARTAVLVSPDTS